MSLNLKELSHDKLIELIESLIFEVNQLKEENKVIKEENRLLKEENRLLKEENQKLKAQLGLNSSNSSKPPSTDGFKKKPKNKNGSPNRTRTCDTTVNSRMLYRLSYQGTLHIIIRN